MTTNDDDLDRRLSGWFISEAPERAPERLRTALDTGLDQTRQRHYLPIPNATVLGGQDCVAPGHRCCSRRLARPRAPQPIRCRSSARPHGAGRRRHRLRPPRRQAARVRRRAARFRVPPQEGCRSLRGSICQRNSIRRSTSRSPPVGPKRWTYRRSSCSCRLVPGLFEQPDHSLVFDNIGVYVHPLAGPADGGPHPCRASARMPRR